MMSSSPASPLRKWIKSIAALRPQLDAHVADRADILGSMLGVKLRNGKPTNQVGLTYFVRKKIPKHKLTPRKRVPTRLLTEHGYVLTDVLEWPEMVEQNPLPTILTDGRHQGTMSCFAVSEFGVFGLSCAHCLTGLDQNPATPTEVAHFDRPSMGWLPSGVSANLAYSPGRGVQGDFGYLDCGLFDLRDADLVERATRSVPARMVSDLQSLVGQRMLGMSALFPDGNASPIRRATVVGVESYAMGELCDFVLEVEPPGTYKGDSGMIWMTEDGRLAGIHGRGENSPAGSRLTTAMHAKRAAKWLDVNLLIG